VGCREAGALREKAREGVVWGVTDGRGVGVGVPTGGEALAEVGALSEASGDVPTVPVGLDVPVAEGVAEVLMVGAEVCEGCAEVEAVRLGAEVCEGCAVAEAVRLPRGEDVALGLAEEDCVTRLEAEFPGVSEGVPLVKEEALGEEEAVTAASSPVGVARAAEAVAGLAEGEARGERVGVGVPEPARVDEEGVALPQAV
jgi:hypothetical protein